MSADTFFTEAQLDGTASIKFLIGEEEIVGKLWLAETDFEDDAAYATCGVEDGEGADIFYATVTAYVDDAGHVKDAEADYLVEVGAVEDLSVAAPQGPSAEALDALQEVMVEIAANELTAGMERGR